MPKIYEVEFRLQRILQIVVPGDADDAVVKELVRRKQDDLLAFSPLDVEVTLVDTCTLEEASGLDDAEWRLTDDRSRFCYREETDWVEGELERLEKQESVSPQ